MSILVKFKAEENKVKRVINNYNFDDSEKEDVLQEVFIRFLLNHNTIREKANIGAWLQ